MGREKNIRLIATIIAALAAVPLFMPRYAAAESARGLDHPELITAKNTAIEGVLPARNGESDVAGNRSEEGTVLIRINKK